MSFPIKPVVNYQRRVPTTFFDLANFAASGRLGQLGRQQVSRLKSMRPKSLRERVSTESPITSHRTDLSERSTGSRYVQWCWRPIRENRDPVMTKATLWFIADHSARLRMTMDITTGAAHARRYVRKLTSCFLDNPIGTASLELNRT